MAPNPLPILLTAALALLSSGCIGGDAPGPSLEAHAPEAPAEPAAPASSVTVFRDPCNDSNTSNYGVHMDLGGDLYVRSGPGGALLVFKESNGRSGLQRDPACGTTDTQLADVDPLSLPPAAGVKA